MDYRPDTGLRGFTLWAENCWQKAEDRRCKTDGRDDEIKVKMLPADLSAAGEVSRVLRIFHEDTFALTSRFRLTPSSAACSAS